MPKNSKPKKFSFIIIITLLVGGVFLVGFGVGRISNSILQPSVSFQFNKILNRGNVEFSLIEDVYNLVNEKYVAKDDIDQEALIFGAIRGMVEGLGDPYSVFFDLEETEDFLTSVSGYFEGVGIEISTKDGTLIVISPLKNTPAARAGIKAGDKIIKIDGETTQNITLEQAVSKIRGPKNTEVVLTILRKGVNGEEELDIAVIRERIDVPSVEWELIESNIAYIELTHFSETTKRDFTKIAQEILESSADRIILDLRNNPGGFLDVSIDVAGWFLEKDSLVLIEESASSNKKHKSPGPASLKDFPIVVLQNEGSASAAEILAGALRDNRGADIIGEKSFGKGSVQAFEDLGGGTSLKITVARWITPSGQYINDIGLEPTVKVELPEILSEGEDPQKDKAIEIIKLLR